MRNGIYYLTAYRWVCYVNGKKDILEFTTTTGRVVKRTAIFYESWGNFGSVCISWKGKKIMVLADTILEE